MPVYEYECAKCGNRFDEIQKFSDAPLTKHDGCGGRVKRVLSAPAIQFKGTGWYITDYARKNTSSSGDGKRDGVSDTKVEGKAGDKTPPKSSETKPAKPTKS